MKRPIAIGLAAAALGIAAPVTYQATQGSADAEPKAEAERVSPEQLAEIRNDLDRVSTLGDWLEGAQMVRYVEAANFFDYLRAVEEARQAAIAAAQAAPHSGGSGGGGGSSLDAIKQCESGGNYQAVSPNGQYRGAYQFDQQTWESVGGTGDPAAAPPAEQDQRAQMLYAQRGSQPWACG